jgi:hypothetical protein
MKSMENYIQNKRLELIDKLAKCRMNTKTKKPQTISKNPTEILPLNLNNFNTAKKYFFSNQEELDEIEIKSLQKFLAEQETFQKIEKDLEFLEAAEETEQTIQKTNNVNNSNNQNLANNNIDNTAALQISSVDQPKDRSLENIAEKNVKKSVVFENNKKKENIDQSNKRATELFMASIATLNPNNEVTSKSFVLNNNDFDEKNIPDFENNRTTADLSFNVLNNISSCNRSIETTYNLNNQSTNIDAIKPLETQSTVIKNSNSNNPEVVVSTENTNIVAHSDSEAWKDLQNDEMIEDIFQISNKGRNSNDSENKFSLLLFLLLLLLLLLLLSYYLLK